MLAMLTNINNSDNFLTILTNNNNVDCYLTYYPMLAILTNIRNAS